MPLVRRHHALLAGLSALLAGCPDASPRPPPAVELRFQSDPLLGVRGQRLSTVRVVALDDLGRRAVGYAGPVTLALRGSDPAAELSGTTTRGGPGTFDFDDLIVDRPGAENVLVATGPGLPEQASHAFPVGTPPDAAAGAWPAEVRVGDLDEDGRPDVVTANFTSRDLSLLRGNGDGTLGSPVSIPVTTSPDQLALADLDADGHLDLVTSHRAASELQLRRGRGDGTFDPPVRLATGAGTWGLLVADVDGSGSLDLLVGTTAGVLVLPGRGDGTFADPLASAAAGLERLALADLDEDGKLDLVATAYAASTVSVLLGDGAGRFGPATTVAAGAELVLPRSLAVTDWDGDGHLDVLTVGLWTAGLSVLRGDGAGGLTALESQYLGLGSVGAAEVADLDGDGLPDVAVVDLHCTLTVRRHASPAFTTWFTGPRPLGLALADLDGDGHLDAVTGNEASVEPGSVSVLLGNGDGSFRE